MTRAYREVGPPDPEVDRVVARVVTAAAAELDITRPRVVWFAPGMYPGASIAFYHDAEDTREWLRHGTKLLGRVSPGGGTIYVKASLSRAEAITTAAHEVRHAAQLLCPVTYGPLNENDAEAFAVAFTRKFAKQESSR